MKYLSHPEALTEYAEAVQYYAERRSEVAQAFIDVVEDAVCRIRESPTHWGVMDVLILTECGCCVAMDLYSLALNFVERVATSVVAGVIVSKITQRLDKQKKVIESLKGIETF